MKMWRAVAVVATAIPAMFVVPAIGAAQAPPVCSAEMLNGSIQQPEAPAPDGQNRLTIVLTNTSPQPCMVQGFAGTDLVGPDEPTFGPNYSVARQETDAFTPLTVAPGAAVGSELTYLSDGPQGWTPDRVVVTPPDTTTQLEVPWQGGSVQRQDAATHPGTYVGPLRPV